MIKNFFNTQIIGLFIVSFLFFGVVSGQNKLDCFSINPKLGYFTSFNSISGAVGGVEVNAFKNKILFSAAYFKAQHFLIFGSNPITTYNQLDFLFGSYIGDEFLRLQYQIGFGAFWGVKPGFLITKGQGLFSADTFEKVSFLTVGIPLKIGLKIMPANFISFGVDLQANLNIENSLLMVLFSIEVGKVRKQIN